MTGSRKVRNSIYILLLSFLAGWGCSDSPGPHAGDKKGSQLYCDYRVSGDDESGHVTVLMQFRAGGADGPGVLLEEPAAVYLDSYTLDADSSRNHGVYYEQRWLAHEFDGRHVIRYIDLAGDTLVEQFHFPVFGFRDSFPARIPVADLEIELTGLEGEDTLHILMMDTSYKSRGVDRYIQLINNKIRIPAEDISRLRKGPVLLDIYRDVDRQLGSEPAGGGRLFLSWALRRRFVLE